MSSCERLLLGAVVEGHLHRWRHLLGAVVGDIFALRHLLGVFV